MSIQSSGKLINNYYENHRFWSATFIYFGFRKTDSKGIQNAKHRPLDKI